MFKKSTQATQIDIFTTQSSNLAGKTLKLYENKEGWHNVFREQITMRIDETIFAPLYNSKKGAPNYPTRTLVAMMILKYADGISDEKLFENCRFNMLTRSALGFVNVDEPVPTESTYYLFRKKINDYAEAGNENLFTKVFAQVTKEHCVEFEVSGKRVRMDSKLMGSNIMWLSRYELVHETLRLFYKKIKKQNTIPISITDKLDELLKLDGNKVTYICSSNEVHERLLTLGSIIQQIIALFDKRNLKIYNTLVRVFQEQFIVNEEGEVALRNKKDISAKSVQSPHDTDCDYRNKDGNKVKGFSHNLTESCDDDDGKLNLIGDITTNVVGKSDVDMLQPSIENSQDVFTDKPKFVHADGAYHSPENQKYCKRNSIKLHLHAIQGAKGRYEFEKIDDEITVWDTVLKQYIKAVKITTKELTVKWRVKTEKGYRYFTLGAIDAFFLRKEIEETPIETLQKRNNVEASIFQLGYHFPNNKSRFRGLEKNQMWVTMRCLWVNFVRIFKFLKKAASVLFFELKKTAVIHLMCLIYRNLTLAQRIIMRCYEIREITHLTVSKKND